jgi:hypothetical protein
MFHATGSPFWVTRLRARGVHFIVWKYNYRHASTGRTQTIWTVWNFISHKLRGELKGTEHNWKDFKNGCSTREKWRNSNDIDYERHFWNYSKMATVLNAENYIRVPAEARVRTRVSLCGICGQTGTGTDFFFPSFSVFSCRYYSTLALHIHISPGAWTVCPLVAAV